MTGAGPSTLGLGAAGLGSTARGAPRNDAVAEPRAEQPTVGSPERTERGHAPDRRDGPGEQPADAAPPIDRPFADLLVPMPPSAPAAEQVGLSDSGGDAGPSPGELLALLDGHWFGAHAAAGTAAAANTDADAAPAPTHSPQPPLQMGTTPVTTAGAPVPTHPASGAALAAASAAAPTAGGPLQPSARDPESAPAPDPGIAAEAGAPVETSGATLAGVAPPTAARPQAAVLPPLPMPADASAGFDEGFGTRIAWMAEQRLGHAEIRLNPEHMGRIDVRVQLDGDQVRAEFHSAHAEVRQAIEASLPRLRELLGQHGLQLGQADVGQRQAGDDSPGRARDGTPGRDRAETGPQGPAPLPPSAMRLRGLLDEYA